LRSWWTWLGSMRCFGNEIANLIRIVCAMMSVGPRVNDIAEALGVTRQGLYKMLSQLAEKGFIKYERGVVELGERGVEVLTELYKLVGEVLGVHVIELRGEVVSGLGEGRYYMSLEGYVRGFESVLGFRPYPGTLNVRLYPEYVRLRRYLDVMPGIVIPGFTDGVRTYGSVKVFRAELFAVGDESRRVRGVVLIIERTHHPPSILEFASDVHVRSTLGIEDGTPVTIRVYIG